MTVQAYDASRLHGAFQGPRPDGALLAGRREQAGAQRDAAPRHLCDCGMPHALAAPQVTAAHILHRPGHAGHDGDRGNSGDVMQQRVTRAVGVDERVDRTGGVHVQVPAEDPMPTTPDPGPPVPAPDVPVVPPDDPHRPDVTRQPSIDPPTDAPPVVAPAESPALDPPPMRM